MVSVPDAAGGSGSTQGPKDSRGSQANSGSSGTKFANCIWAKFEDRDNIVDSTDVTYNRNDESSVEIDAFLEQHKGKNWTDVLKKEIRALVIRFNATGGETRTREDMECSTPQIQKAPTTGNVFAVANPDGSSYSIDLKEHTITKYGADGQVISTRSMTEEEQKLSTRELVTKLQKSPETTAAQSTEENPSAETREINGEGISGTYSFVETGNGGYSLKTNFRISSLINNDAKAFLKGFDSVNPSRNEVHNFRGIRARNYNLIRANVDLKAQTIAGYTAIYKDFQAKAASGNTLSAGEQKFMQDYHKVLEKYGLKINDNGELEDI